MKDGVAGTVWIKKPDGTFDGALVVNGAGVLDLGVSLLKWFTEVKQAEQLVGGGAVAEVSGMDGKIERAQSPIVWTSLSDSQMKMTAKTFLGGSYTYIFDPVGREWRAGLGEGKNLAALIGRIQFKKSLLEKAK